MGHDGDPSRRVVITGALIPYKRRMYEIVVSETTSKDSAASGAAVIDYISRLSGGDALGLEIRNVLRPIGCEAVWPADRRRIAVMRRPAVVMVGLV